MLRRVLILLCTPVVVAGCGKPDPLSAYRAELGAIDVSDRAIVELSRREDLMPIAGEFFRALCASCHAASGSGLIGPSLTDDVYINIARPQDLFDVITHGRHAKGMPEWGTKIERSKRLLLAAYAASLRNTNQDGKAPQGEPIPAWETFRSD
jgi:cytochrome c oxidase cbb3-type subunit 3